GSPSILYMAGSRPTTGWRGSRSSGIPPQTRGPGKWTYKTPTTESEQALAYQEQITGRPSWYVYEVDKVEFDGFNGKELLEAKGASYKKFTRKDGTLQPWFENGDGFKGLLEQAGKQSLLADRLNLPLVWHVAEVEFANALRRVFRQNGLDRIDVRCTPPT
ncbi:MAG: Tox-REase-5 domain-containing protein, partial [Cystobacter sp.]